MAKGLCYKTVELHENTFAFGRNTNSHYLNESLLEKKFYTRLSRKQFALERNGKKVYLTDHSSSGTFINGQLLGNGNSVELFHNDMLSFGLKEHNAFLFLLTAKPDDNVTTNGTTSKSNSSRTSGKRSKQADNDTLTSSGSTFQSDTSESNVRSDRRNRRKKDYGSDWDMY